MSVPPLGRTNADCADEEDCEDTDEALEEDVWDCAEEA
jgi:hypothetical protein